MEKAIIDPQRGNINLIVAAALDGAIGRGGNLIWRIPADLRRFKSLTMGHAIIMGRKTWESLPKRPLPGRRNIVVTRSGSYEAPGAEVARSPESAIRMAVSGPDKQLSQTNSADSVGDKDIFVIGGAELYSAFLPIADRIYLTEIDATCPDADAHLPYPLYDAEWCRVEESGWESTDEVRYRYVTLERTMKP